MTVAALVLASPAPASAITYGGTIPGPTLPEGQPFSGVILTTSCSGASDISAISIDWGDGSALDTSSGKVADNPSYNACDFSGSHTYADGSQFVVKIAYTSAAHGPQSVSFTQYVVDKAAKTFTPPTFAASAGRAFSGRVATFSDSAGLSPSGYGASISWGDGTSYGIVSGNVISGEHVYAYPGSYFVWITLTDDDPQPPGIVGETGTGGGTVGGYVTVGGNCPGTPVRPAARFTATAGSANANYVQALYHDLLGRPTDAIRAPALIYGLDAGTPREAVVRALLATNDYRTRLIGEEYQTFLHRPADPSGLANSLALLTSGGTDEQLLGRLLASPEYTQPRQSDLPNAAFCDVLQRPLHLPDPYAPNNLFPSQLGPELVTLPAYAEVRVNNWYEEFLRRPPDPTELGSAVGGLEAGRTDEETIASLLSSPAYLDMFKPKDGATKLAISPRGVIRLTLTRPATVGLVVLRVLPASPGKSAASITPQLPLPSVRRVGTVSFGRRAGHVAILWSRKINGHRLARGRYLLQITLRRGAATTNLGDALPIRFLP